MLRAGAQAIMAMTAPPDLSESAEGRHAYAG
jgi:hypothetical protein